MLTFSLSAINYPITLISKAVVCGGMLAVINDAWRTLTRRPGTSWVKFNGSPAVLKIMASSGTLNLMTDDGFPSLMVVKLLFRLSISKILPTVILSETGLLAILIIKAFDWGGMLLVMAEEKAAFTVMPFLKSEAGIVLPRSSKIRVLSPTTSRTV